MRTNIRPYIILCSENKLIYITDVLSTSPLNVGFQRVLTHNKWEISIHLLQRLTLVHLINEEDNFWWGLACSGSFTTKSMYLDLLWTYTFSTKTYLEDESTT